MPVYQFLLNLSDTHGGGWSEQFFQTWPDTLTARAWMNTYIGARVALLAKGYAIQQGRVSDVQIFRDSLIQNTFSGPALNGNLGNDAVSGERLFERLLVRLEAGPARRRSFSLGGLPGSVCDQNGAYNPVFPWVALFQNWSNYITGTGGYTNPCLIHQRGVVPVVLPTPITTFTSQPGGGDQRALFLTVNGDVHLSYPNRSQVRISKTRNSQNVNGVWQVLNTTVNLGPPVTTIIALASRRYIPVYSSNTLPGIVVPILGASVADYSSITSVIPQRGVRRKSGRPFGEPRGRSSRQG